jgi:hypothetical protein
MGRPVRGAFEYFVSTSDDEKRRSSYVVTIRYDSPGQFRELLATPTGIRTTRTLELDSTGTRELSNYREVPPGFSSTQVLTPPRLVIPATVWKGRAWETTTRIQDSEKPDDSYTEEVRYEITRVDRVQVRGQVDFLVTVLETRENRRAEPPVRSTRERVHLASSGLLLREMERNGNNPTIKRWIARSYGLRA